MKNSKINFMPISDHLATENTFVDNEIADAFKLLPVFSLLGIRKRSGVKVQPILFAMLIWPMLGAKSIHAFCGKCIRNYIQGSIDTLYAFMRRTDLNWQAMSARVALLVYNKQFAKDCRQAAFVVDDTLKKRRGKKVQGACYHFDHNEKRSVFSQQFVQLGLTGIFQLKRNSTKYRFQGRDYTLSELYVLVKRKMKRSAKGRYRTYALTVELSLPVKEKQNPRTALKLVFSSDVRNHNENWVVFVCTDTQLSAEEVLLAYSKCWAVEVYFKELKQNPGFLKEQSGHFTVCYASSNLSAIRYMLLLNLMLEKGTLKFGQLLNKATGQIELLSFAAMLWEVFKGLLCERLQKMQIPAIGELLETIQAQFEEFLNQALQMDISMQTALRKAEDKGFL